MKYYTPEEYLALPNDGFAGNQFDSAEEAFEQFTEVGIPFLVEVESNLDNDQDRYADTIWFKLKYDDYTKPQLVEMIVKMANLKPDELGVNYQPDGCEIRLWWD